MIRIRKNKKLLSEDLTKRCKSGAYVSEGVSYCQFCGKKLLTEDLMKLRKKDRVATGINNRSVIYRDYYKVCRECYKKGNKPDRIN